MLTLAPSLHRGTSGRWLFTTPKVLRRRETIEMDLKLPFAKAPIDLRGLLLHLALRVGLPVDAVKQIRNEFLSSWWGRVTGRRRLTYTPFDGQGINNGQGLFYRGWAGTQRANNQRNLVDRFWYTSNIFWAEVLDHLFTFQFPQPLVY